MQEQLLEIERKRKFTVNDHAWDAEMIKAQINKSTEKQ